MSQGSRDRRAAPGGDAHPNASHDPAHADEAADAKGEQALEEMVQAVREAVETVEARARRRQRAHSAADDAGDPPARGATPPNAPPIDSPMPDAGRAGPGERGSYIRPAMAEKRSRWPRYAFVFILLLAGSAAVAFVLGRSDPGDRVALSVNGDDAGATAARLTREERLEIERLLADLDFQTGPVDGEIDAQTRRAITAYQRISGAAEPDGTASSTLLEELRQVAADAGA